MLGQESSPFDTPDSCTDESKRQYFLHAKSLRNAYKEDTGKNPNASELVYWYVERDQQYAQSTLRGYRLGLRELLKWALLENRIDAKVCDELLAVLLTGPQPKPRGTEKKTSSKKRKSLPNDDLSSLLDWLDDNATTSAKNSFMADYIRFSLTFFPRPQDWDGARIIQIRAEDNKIFRVLRFPNAKTTNGRSHGPYRDLDLVDDLLFIRDLMNFLRDFKNSIEAVGSAAKLQEHLRKRLTLVCKLAKAPVISPYTLRHIGMAVAKETMDQLAVSYAAGHGSDRTKVERYARSRSSGSGWLSPAEAFSVPTERAQLVRETGRVVSNRRELSLQKTSTALAAKR